jgi:hypothetical protein
MAENYLISLRNRMMNEPMPEKYLTLLRIGPDLKGDEQGILKVMQGDNMVKAFSTRENDIYITKKGKALDTLKHSSLRIGTYEYKHSMKAHYLDGRPMKNPIKCLRPTDKRIERILIHRAHNNDPDTLAGCISPGKWGTLYSFEDSVKAMEELFIELGGWAEDKLVTLIVLSNASRGVGYGETKDNWWRTR